MIGDNCQQWSCIECVIKKQEYEDKLSKLEQRFMVYKQKLVLTDELISKYNAKCKENESLQKQQKKNNALLKEYRSKLMSAVKKQMPLEEELEKLKKIKVGLEVKLEAETGRYAATEKHNVQLDTLVQQLKDEIVQFEMKLELQKEATSNLTRSLNEAKAEKLSMEKKRLKTLKNVVSFADFVQKGRLTSTQKKMLARWHTELGCLVNGEDEFSEDEGIFSPALASSCSSRDTGLSSITDLLSDDDHSSVVSVRLESNTSSVKDQSAGVTSDLTHKTLTSDHRKKVQHRNQCKLSSTAIVAPLIVGSKSEVMVGQGGVQLQESSEVAAKVNSCSSTVVSLNKTCVQEAVTENRSEVDNVKYSDRNLMGSVTQKAGQTSGVKSLGPLSLFDPDVSLTLSGAGNNEEVAASEAGIDGNGADLLCVMDNSDCTSTMTRVESPVDKSLCIKNIMEEMRSIPNPLSPLDPETSLNGGQCHSPLTSNEPVELRDASTWTWVEMSDAAVGMDKVADSSHHVAVQTSQVTSCTTACQASIITYNTCAVQTDERGILHTADSISHSEDKFCHCRSPEERTIFSIDKGQDKVEIFGNSVTNDSDQMSNSLKSYGSLSKRLGELNCPKLTSEQKYVESKSKKISIIIRCDYKPETRLKMEVNKLESLAPWLCSDKSDNVSVEKDPVFVSEDFSTPATAVQPFISRPLIQECMLSGSKRLAQQRTPAAVKRLMRQITPATNKCLARKRASATTKCLTQHSTPTTDRPVTHQNTQTASGVFAVEDAQHLLGYLKEIHPHECLMQVVPYCQNHHMHMDPHLFQPNMLSCQLPVQSVTERWKGCCYKNTVNGACAEWNRPCVSQGLQNYCCSCSPCVSTNQSNCRPPKREATVQISSVRSASNKSTRRVWKRILDTEDSTDDLETGDDHRMPCRKLSLKNHVVNSISITDTDSEVENTTARRKGIFADKQYYAVGAGSGRKMGIKQLRKRRKVHTSDTDSACNTNEERDEVVRLRKINSSLKGNKQTRGFSGSKQENSTFSKLKKRKNKYSENYQKNVVKCMLQKTLGQNFSFSKVKCRSKCLMPGQVNEHVEGSDTPGMKVGNEAHISQHEAVKHVQDFRVGSCNVDLSSVVQSGVQQEMADIAATEEGSHKLFGCLPDMCTSKKQHSGRTVVELQTVQAQNVSDSSLKKCKRKASSQSASQVESRITDYSLSMIPKSKRAKTSSVGKGSGISMISNDLEQTSSVALHPTSESSSEKYAVQTCRASTSIILPSVEQGSPNQECKVSAANEKFKMLSSPETGQAVGKPDASRHVGPQIRLSKLEKLRRNLMKAKRPTKIATELPKTLKCRKSLELSSKSSCVGSDCKKPGIRGLPRTARKGRILDSVTSVSNLLLRSPHQSTPMLSLKAEKPSAKHDAIAPGVVNELVNHSNKSNPVVDHPLTSDMVTKHESNTRREIHTETNCSVDVRSIVSTEIVLDVEVPSSIQDSSPLSNHVMETVSSVSEVNNVSGVQVKSTLTAKVPKAVEVPALPVSCKEGVSEASDLQKVTGLVTLPDVCDKVGDISESVKEVCLPGIIHKKCEKARDSGGAKLPTTISKVGGREDVVLPNFCQELTPCCISPIKDPEVGELQVSSEVKSSAQTSDTVHIAELPSAKLPTTVSSVGGGEDVMLPNFYQELTPCCIKPVKDCKVGELQQSSEFKSSIQTSGTLQSAELPSAGLSTESPVRMTRSSICQTTDKCMTVMESVVTKSTDRIPFTGSLCQQVLKDYEVEYRKKHKKKRKSMTGAMKQQEKVILEREVQELLSSNFNSRKFREVVKKFSDLNSESVQQGLAKIIVKVVSDDIKDQPNSIPKHHAPPLTPTQQCLVTLVFTLQSKLEQYKAILETILLGIEYLLFRLGHVPNVARACSLARFYATLCLIHRDKLRIQAFCYDAMYSLNYKAFPLLFTVYTTYPDALPHADVGKDVLLVITMSSLILTQSLGRNQLEYRIRDLKSLLQTHYGYSQRILTVEQLLQLLVDRLRNSDGHVEGLQASIILLAKRMGWNTTYRQLLCHKLIPMVDEWRAGAVSDGTAVEVITVMGYVTRCFPTEEAKVHVQAVLHVLETVLLDKNVPIEVQEAAAASLLRLSRHNFFYVSNLLVKWQPSGGSISDSLLREMLFFFGIRTPKWWHTFLKKNTG